MSLDFCSIDIIYTGRGAESKQKKFSILIWHNKSKKEKYVSVMHLENA